MLICIENHRTCDFSGGPDPYLPSGSAHVLKHQLKKQFKPFSNSDMLQTSNYGTIKLCGLHLSL